MVQTFKAYIRCKVTTPEGKVVYNKQKACHSFVLGFLGMMEAMMRGAAAGGVQVRDILNSLEQFMDNTIDFNKVLCVGDADDSDTFGIIVGTGTTAPTNADYVIETKIAHGVGAGQLDYNVVSFVAAAVVATNVDFQIVRTFTNGSGNLITVEEVAIYAHCVNLTAASKYICLIHDLTGGVAVANGNTLTVTYTLRTTV